MNGRNHERWRQSNNEKSTRNPVSEPVFGIKNANTFHLTSLSQANTVKILDHHMRVGFPVYGVPHDSSFFKEPSPASFNLCSSFQTNIRIFQQINVKKCPASKRC